MSWLLAREWARAGHQIVLITQTPAGLNSDIEAEMIAAKIKIVRQPTRRELWRLVKWCEVYFHNNLSLQTAWPLLLQRKPWVIAHHTYLSRPDGTRGWQDYLKKLVLCCADNIAVSKITAQQLPVSATIIGNCYRDDLFFGRPEIKREKELIFLGRLVSDKGVDTLLEALGILKRRAVKPRLTIVGEGPEKDALQALATQWGLSEQIEWAGATSGEKLARLLCEHHILVIPSRWREPFGVVALEGLACGCVAIGSREGGLADAIGPCGLLFQNGDAHELAVQIESLINSPAQREALVVQIPAHIKEFAPARVASRYLKVLKKANSV